MKKIISTKKAPKAIGVYSQGTVHNSLVFTSGQICLNPKTEKLVMNSFENEIKQVLENINSILIEAGSSLDQIIKLTVFITDLSLINQLNKVFLEYFPNNPPARSTVEVLSLPMNVRVEIEAVGIIRL